ncbi:MAG: hypothetical protein LBH81_02485 [Rickettsiales bacterium]|jgi:hypothetical protein|nr:hypothetical protein [Rickettsiales bacterium]
MKKLMPFALLLAFTTPVFAEEPETEPADEVVVPKRKSERKEKPDWETQFYIAAKISGNSRATGDLVSDEFDPDGAALSYRKPGRLYALALGADLKKSGGRVELEVAHNPRSTAYFQLSCDGGVFGWYPCGDGYYTGGIGYTSFIVNAVPYVHAFEDKVRFNLLFGIGGAAMKLEGVPSFGAVAMNLGAGFDFMVSKNFALTAEGRYQWLYGEFHVGEKWPGGMDWDLCLHNWQWMLGARLAF